MSSLQIPFPAAGRWFRAAWVLALCGLPLAAPAAVPYVKVSIGVTRNEVPIPALIQPRILTGESGKRRVVLVAGLDPGGVSTDAALRVLEAFLTTPEWRGIQVAYDMAVVPGVFPEGMGEPAVKVKFPPDENAYQSRTAAEAQYLWRWLGVLGPDLVVEIRAAEGVTGLGVPDWSPFGASSPRSMVKDPSADVAEDSLAAALGREAPAGIGRVPALQWRVGPGSDPQELLRLLEGLAGLHQDWKSPARSEMDRRLERTPEQVARQLEKIYGRQLKSLGYTETVALIGRLRVGDWEGTDTIRRDVERVLAPWVTGGKPALPEKPSGSILAGHLAIAELARRTGNPAYTELVRAAADVGFDVGGRPLPAVPSHNEMSDAVFMACPILVQAGVLTGERKYFDQAVRHLDFMRKLCRREDGLYRHSPLDESPWGRGNGFPALGLALCLTDFPKDHPGRETMLAAYREHIAALLRHQDPSGAWHQVVDFPGSYRELTSTSMITFALARGVREGWLQAAEVNPAIARAWTALKRRIGPDGALVDVCTGTGKQKSRRDYLDRKAILGRDARGGSMALLAATEVAAWEKAGGAGPN